MPDTYLMLKVLHILGSTVLFGTGIGTAFHFWMANRSGDVAAIHQSARITVIADFAFTTPAVVLQPATGIALAAMAGFPLTSTWIVASFVLYGVAGACWLPVVVFQVRMRNLAAHSLRDAKPLPAEYHRLARAWFLLGWPAFASLLAVFWLMVAKPA
jgi:uncharacterized membrane protein